MIKLSQQSIIELFVDKLLLLGCKRITRTVCKADPTEIVTIKGEIGLRYGLEDSWPGPYSDPPDPMVVKVKVVESPYGTEINFKDATGPNDATSCYSAYLDDDSKWHRPTGNKFFLHLKRLIEESVSAGEVRNTMEPDDTHGYGNFV